MRLIDAEALKEKLQARHDNGEDDFDKGYNIGIEAAIELLDNAPTVEGFTKEDMSGAYYEGYACGSRESERPQGRPLNDAMRLINAEALIDAFKAWKAMDDYYHNTDCDDIPFSEAFNLIDLAPTVFDDKAYSDGYTQGTCDCEHAHKRPKGDWLCATKLTFPQYQPDEYMCSNCKKICQIKYYYCPFCGADMRGDSHG